MFGELLPFFHHSVKLPRHTIASPPTCCILTTTTQINVQLKTRSGRTGRNGSVPAPDVLPRSEERHRQGVLGEILGKIGGKLKRERYHVKNAVLVGGVQQNVDFVALVIRRKVQKVFDVGTQLERAVNEVPHDEVIKVRVFAEGELTAATPLITYKVPTKRS